MAPCAVLACCTWFTGLDRLAACLDVIDVPTITIQVLEPMMTILIEIIRSASIEMISSVTYMWRLGVFRTKEKGFFFASLEGSALFPKHEVIQAGTPHNLKVCQLIVHILKADLNSLRPNNCHLQHLHHFHHHKQALARRRKAPCLEFGRCGADGADEEECKRALRLEQ